MSSGSLTVKIGNYTNQKNALTKDTTWERTYTDCVTMKGETSLTDPVLIINDTIANLKNCNYVWIGGFHRYYFITNIKSIRSYLIEVTCHVDVLNSFRDEIKEQSAIVEKSAKLFNTLVNDGSIKVYQDRYVMNYGFLNQSFTDFNYVLALAGS